VLDAGVQISGCCLFLPLALLTDKPGVGREEIFWKEVLIVEVDGMDKGSGSVEKYGSGTWWGRRALNRRTLFE
jgi:hypothetical protein